MLLSKVKNVFSVIPILKTERLILRQMRVSDAGDMYEYSRIPEVSRYLLWSPHPNIAHTKAYLSYLQTQYKTGNHYDWAVVLRDSGKMIGTCGFAKIDSENNFAELGYVLNPLFWHKGYATEAAEAVIAFGFEQLLLNRIEARYMEENTESRRVMERLGMTFEGFRRKAVLIKGEYETVGICSVLKDEFVKRKSECL